MTIITLLMSFVRHLVSLAREFERLLETDGRFEITAPTTLAIVTFRLKDTPNEVNEWLIK